MPCSTRTAPILSVRTPDPQPIHHHHACCFVFAVKDPQTLAPEQSLPWTLQVDQRSPSSPSNGRRHVYALTFTVSSMYIRYILVLVGITRQDDGSLMGLLQYAESWSSANVHMQRNAGAKALWAPPPTASCPLSALLPARCNPQFCHSSFPPHTLGAISRWAARPDALYIAHSQLQPLGVNTRGVPSQQCPSPTHPQRLYTIFSSFPHALDETRPSYLSQDLPTISYLVRRSTS